MERDNCLAFSVTNITQSQKWYRKNITHTYNNPALEKPTAYEDIDNGLHSKKDNALKTAFNMIHKDWNE